MVLLLSSRRAGEPVPILSLANTPAPQLGITMFSGGEGLVLGRT